MPSKKDSANQKSTPTPIRLPEEILQRVEAVAQKRGGSGSKQDIMREAIDIGLEIMMRMKRSNVSYIVDGALKDVKSFEGLSDAEIRSKRELEKIRDELLADDVNFPAIPRPEGGSMMKALQSAQKPKHAS